MVRAKSVTLTGNCPHCGESVELVISKKEVKMIYKGFKKPIGKGEAEMNAHVLRRNAKLRKAGKKL